MGSLSKRERVDAALLGALVDRVPVAAWQHFIPEERSVATLAEAHLNFFDAFDWDWLKVNSRATVYAEAWGNQYDFGDYSGVLPRLLHTAITTPDDLDRITPRDPAVGALGEQLDLIRRIKAEIGDAHFVQTVFSPLSVLAFLIARPPTQTADLDLPSRFDRLRDLLHTRPEAVHAALDAISTTLASYAAASVDAGASGVFYAIVRLARRDVLTPDEYATFGRPYDLRVLEAVQGAPFNLLHICGSQVYFDQVADYPVHAINWASIGQHNPSIAEARNHTDKALIGGVDEHGVLAHGTPSDVVAAAQAAIAAGSGRKFLLTPGCGLGPHVPAANLHALRRAVDHAEEAIHV